MKSFFLLRKIALPYPHKCLFCGAKLCQPTRIFKNYPCRERWPVVCTCPCLGSDPCWQKVVKKSSLYLWPLWEQHVFLQLSRWSMNKWRTQKDMKCAPGCWHTLFDWDCHQFYFPCREKSRGEDICAKSNSDDCYNCLQFMAEQKQKLRSKTKKREQNPAVVINKEVKDSLLEVESHPSTVIDLPIHSTTVTPNLLLTLCNKFCKDWMACEVMPILCEINPVKFLLHNPQLMQKKLMLLMAV